MTEVLSVLGGAAPAASRRAATAVAGPEGPGPRPGAPAAEGRAG